MKERGHLEDLSMAGKIINNFVKGTMMVTCEVVIRRRVPSKARKFFTS
jgi:hypothetical protein